ncbi:type VII secretion protein EccE [Streptomyces sp. NPDC050504]|uniref:type VII secretion protein EccE n=1 Tax=Streptomyces sp. NPDC050504 TaxID=3365618 RepID=UPI0037AA7836
MRTATRGDNGPAGGDAPGPARPRRGTRGGRRGGGAAEAGQMRAPAKVTLRPLSRGSRVGPLRLRQLVLVEAALCVATVGLALGAPWRVPALSAGGALALSALLRLRGRPLLDSLPVARAYRSRTRRAVSGAESGGTDGVAPALAPLVECAPSLAPYPYASSGQRPRSVGMVGDGTFLTAVVRVEATGDALRPAFGARAFPLALLGDVLAVDGIVLESAQLVQQVRCAPAPLLPERSAARLSYTRLQRLQGGATAPALRLTWVAVKLDPELCGEAVAARGGGLAGSQRCLVRAADHLASRITGAGFRALVLDQDALESALATAACTDVVAETPGGARAADGGATHGGGGGGGGPRGHEGVLEWWCDERWHSSYAVGHWPSLGPGAAPFSRVVSLLTSVPSYANTLSLTVRRGPYQGHTRVSGHLRITGGPGAEPTGARTALREAARSAEVGLVRLDREQVPGLLATVPLGGGR